MKQLLLLFFLIPFLSLGQVQIGQDIDGEASGDRSGLSVALSSDGSTVAIGAPGNDANGSLSGHVRVYNNDNGVWTQVGQDIDGEFSFDLSGHSVALSSDGSIVAIGSTFNNSQAGHVRIYSNDNGTWTQIGSDIDGEAPFDESAHSIALSSDGNTVAIGAPRNIGSGNNSGHVRIYSNDNGTWAQVGSDIDSEGSNDRSGYSVALSSDGSIVAIGAIFNNGNGSQGGHVRIYENDNGLWTQIGNDIDGEASGDWSGWSVALSSDGNTVAIGAPLNDGNGSDSGHVRIYSNDNSVWTQIGSDIDGEESFDESGRSLALSSDGNIVAIGAYFNSGNGVESGHVRIYKNESNNWIQIGNDIDGEVSGDQNGRSLALSSDGNTLAIGAPENGNALGHVRVYDISAILSTEEQTISNFNLYPNPTNNQFTIQLENPIDLQNVSIYNNLGQLVLTSKETIIDTSKLTSGLYIVELETTKGKASKKLIIE